MRQAFAGMLWSKQLYDYDVARWLDGDPTQPPPPESRLDGRNARWRNFDAFDIMSMPDKWEYPWFAAWDLAFHCVALAHVDPAFAKYQLLLLCREWFQHPNGALPAYEWDFGDVNPPVQAWAALEVFAIDGGRDLDFLSRVFDKLLVNFTWWVNREDADGLEPVRGRLPRARQHRPARPLAPAGRRHARAVRRHRLDGVLRAGHGRHRARSCNRSGQRPAADLVLKFLEHFAAIRSAMDDQGLWDDADGLYYDRLVTPDGTRGAGQGPVDGRHHPAAGRRRRRRGRCSTGPSGRASSFAGFLDREGLRRPREARRARAAARRARATGGLLLGVVGIDRLERLFAKLFDEAEFLSPYGLRALSAYHREHPYELEVEGVRATIDYEPAESTTAMFGGNSNWRGPIWFPLNYLRDQRAGALPPVLRRRLHRRVPDRVRATSCRSTRSPPTCANGWSRSSWSGPDGRRPCFGGVERLQNDPAWKDNLVFNEYFHGDNGAGLGAVAPDRLDRAGRRPDPPPARSGALHRRRAPGAPAGRDRGRERPVGPGRRGRACWFPLGATVRDGGTNFAVASGVADGMLLCLFDERRRGDPGPAAGPRRRRLARLRAGRRRRARRTATARPGPYDPARGAALQPGQAAARPVRPGDRRRGPLRAGGARPRRPTTPTRPSTLDSAAPRAAQPGRRPGLRRGPTEPGRRRRYADTVIYEVHVKGFTAPTRTSRRSSAAPTPGWPRGRASPTWSTSA